VIQSINIQVLESTQSWIYYENGEKYNGTLFGGRKHGRGVLVEYSSGLSYIGEFYNDFRHGQGTLSNVENDYVYDGEWANDVKNGQGQLITHDFKYSGSFKNNMYHGIGVYCDKVGNLYDGEWINGHRNGISHFTTADGSKFIGEFKDDKMNGNGQWNYADGTIFSGEYELGEKWGHGIKWYDVEKGIKYQGAWKDNKPGGGKGTYNTADGETIEALWENGRVIPNDIHQPEYTNKEGETSIWSELDDQTRDKILSITLE
jgi:hypothetical protein